MKKILVAILLSGFSLLMAAADDFVVNRSDCATNTEFAQRVNDAINPGWRYDADKGYWNIYVMNLTQSLKDAGQKQSGTNRRGDAYKVKVVGSGDERVASVAVSRAKGYATCSTCEGLGYVFGKPSVRCGTCEGTGRVKK